MARSFAEAFVILAEDLKKEMKTIDSPILPLVGLAAWLPSPEETKHFYRCRCNEMDESVCYSPEHRSEGTIYGFERD